MVLEGAVDELEGSSTITVAGPLPVGITVVVVARGTSVVIVIVVVGREGL